MLKATLLATALAVTLALPASATTLVTSLAAFQAGAKGTVSSTPNPGSYDLGQPALPTTTTIALNDGSMLALSNTAQVTTPQNGFPFLLADGFAGELFIPQDATGNQVSSETINFGSAVTALGFEVAPFSNAFGAPYIGFAGGPYTVSVTLGNGQTSAVSLPGGNLIGGVTTSQFFGFFGGGVTALTISSSDPNGLGFGNFVDVSVPVPEPASIALMLVGVAGLLRGRRRSAAA